MIDVPSVSKYFGAITSWQDARDLRRELKWLAVCSPRRPNEDVQTASPKIARVGVRPIV